VHDESLARTTDVERRFPDAAPWGVDDLTLAQIRTLDAGSWFGSGTYTGARVLTLAGLLTELADSPVGLVVEAKSPQTADGVDGIGDAVMAVLASRPEWNRASRDGSPRLVLESFRWPFLDGMHTAYPALPLVLLGETVSPADLAAHPYVTEVDVKAGALTSDLVRAARRRGVAVGVYTVNDRAAISRAVTVGVDGVTSDRPDRVRAVLDAVDRLWSGTLWPSAPDVAGVRVSTAPTALVGGRLAVRARLVDTAGRPVRWHRLRVQTRVSGRWADAARVVTGATGRSDVSLPARLGMRVRVAAAGHWSAVATPTVRR
jgi:glycerophosphoryl diester phosphodiesterase